MNEVWTAGTIRSLRRGLFLTQAQFGQRLLVDRYTINKWEGGKGRPSIRNQIKLNELAATRTVS